MTVVIVTAVIVTAVIVFCGNGNNSIYSYGSNSTMIFYKCLAAVFLNNLPVVDICLANGAQLRHW